MTKAQVVKQLRTQAGKAQWGSDSFGPIRSLSFNRASTADYLRIGKQVEAVLGAGMLFSVAGDTLFWEFASKH